MSTINYDLSRIKALAFEEGPNENFRCYGWGDIECHGIKVERKTSGFR